MNYKFQEEKKKIFNVNYKLNLVNVNYDDSKIEEVKFLFFIPINVEEKVKSFSEAR